MAELGWQCFEIPGMPIYADIDTPTVDKKDLIELKSPDDLKEGRQVLAGFFEGFLRMQVKRDEYGELFLDSGGTIASVEFDARWGWLATQFVNPRALKELTLNTESIE